MNIFFIRHAQTRANIERRYLGRTDEPLSPAGVESFCNLAYPAVNRVYASPLLRCVQTAGILYPMEQPVLIDGLRECDFGEFENKTWYELKDRPDYQAWIDSHGKGTPPGGEPPEAFKARVCAAFAQSMGKSFRDGLSDIAFVVHGGTIMAVMEQYAVPHRDFYGWQVENLGGWAVTASIHTWTERQVLQNPREIGAG